MGVATLGENSVMLHAILLSFIVFLFGSVAKCADQKPLTLDTTKGEVNAIHFTPDGKTLVVGTDRVIKVWELPSVRERAVESHHPGRIGALAMSPDGKVIASGGGSIRDKRIIVWDLATCKPRLIHEDLPAAVKSLAFSADGKSLASANYDSHVYLWSSTALGESAKLEGHKSVVKHLAFARNRQLLASSDETYRIKLWNPATRKNLGSIEHGGVFAEFAGFSHDGKTLAINVDFDSVQLWNVDGFELRHTIRIEGRSCLNWFAISPDNKIIAVLLAGHPDDDEFREVVRLLSSGNGKVIASLTYPGNRVRGICCPAFSPCGKTLAIGHGQMVDLWDVSHYSGHNGR